MFASNFHFKEILEWFGDSHFEYLMLFLPSRDTRDRKIDDYIIRNQASIDELTGRNIAYISYTEMDLHNEIKHVKKHQLPPNAIRTHVYISDEVCDYYSFGHYKLPALILISKQLEYKLFPIASETDLDSYFAPIGIITSFLGDYHRVKWNKNRFKSLENDKKRKIEECSRLSEENIRLEKTFELKDDEELATRIDNNYCRLFNHLKAKKVKQNTFENVFIGNLDENEIIHKLDKLGIDEELHKYALELINDLKKVCNFKKFQAQYGNVAQQIKRLVHLCGQEINDNIERIRKLTNEISDIENELLVAPEKLKEYDEELNEIKRVWGNKLNNTLFIDNGMEILSNTLDGYSNVLIDILTTVYEKLKKNNVDNIQIKEKDGGKVFRNGEYDVFISYSRKDSEQVLSVVRELQKRGFTTWIDKDGIESGDAFKSVIVRAIKNSDIFLFFSSSSSNASPWTVKEVNTAVHLKKPIIPVRLDGADYDDSILFDLGSIDFVDLNIEENREAALNKLINTLLSKIPNVVVKQPNQESKMTSLTNKEGFEVGYDLAVFTIHKLRGQTSEKDEDLIAQRLTELKIDPKTLFGKLDAGTMIPNLSNCALRLGELYGKDMENSVCLGSLFILSVIAKRSNISEEFGHSYDEGIVVACQRLSIPDSFTEELIKSTDDGMEEMLGELKGMLDVVGKDHTALLTAEECYKKGIDCFESKKFEEAVSWFRGSAEKGNASAQCYLGYLYENGIGVEKSNIEAVKWYTKAAEQGDTLAQNNLGSMYREGKGVQKDVDEAARWFRVAAGQGHVLAQYNLAIMYQIGAGVKQDEAEAVRWYREAANQGLPQAQYSLGNMYRTGNGLKEKDEREAVEWFKKAAEQGLADAQHNLGYMYYNGCGVEKDVDEAVRWLNKAATQGHSGAKNALKMILGT